MSAAMGRRYKWAWALAAIFCLFFALWSALWFWADLAAFRARSWVEAWQNQTAIALRDGRTYVPAEESWLEARSAAQTAVRLSPVSADYLVILARVEEMRYPMALIGEEQARPGRERAVQLYRDAIKRRPSWPYLYADLAYALMRLDRVDAELERALADAARLGPWEPPVMQAIIDVGFEAWYRLSPDARRVVSETLIRSQSPERAGGRNKKHADEMWERVRAHRKQALACSLLPMTNERNRHICHPDNW